MERYAQAAQSCSWDVAQGYLLTVLRTYGNIAEATGSEAMRPKTMTAGLLRHAECAGSGDHGFTMHLPQVGAAVVRTIAEEDITATLAAVGWVSEKVEHRYVGAAACCIRPLVAEAGFSRANMLSSKPGSEYVGPVCHSGTEQTSFAGCWAVVLCVLQAAL